MAKKQKKLEEISKKFGEERQKALDTALKNIEKDFGNFTFGPKHKRKYKTVETQSL